jgi:hypothetical protein
MKQDVRKINFEIAKCLLGELDRKFEIDYVGVRAYGSERGFKGLKPEGVAAKLDELFLNGNGSEGIVRVLGTYTILLSRKKTRFVISLSDDSGKRVMGWEYVARAGMYTFEHTNSTEVANR